MFCTKCGQMLNNDNMCTNENCPSKTMNNSTTFNSANEFTQQQNDNYQQSYGNDGFNPNPYGYRDSRYNNEATQDLMLFIGEKNTEYYMEKYTRYQQNESFSSWNWAAFFLNIYWLLYRKMYGYAAAFFGVQFVIILLTSVFAPILNLALAIGFGMFANQIYIKFALSKVRSLKFAIPGMSVEDIKRRIAANGGTNLAAPLILLGIVVVLSIILFVLFVFAFAAFDGYYRYYY